MAYIDSKTNPFAQKKESESPDIIDKARDKFGDIQTYRKKAEEWLEKAPSEYLEYNVELRLLHEEDVELATPKNMKILLRKMTTVEHIEWINSVADRINTMKKEVRESSCPPKEHFAGMQGQRVPRERLEEEFEASQNSALTFMDSVEDFLYRNLSVTEDQMERLNEIYKRYERI